MKFASTLRDSNQTKFKYNKENEPKRLVSKLTSPTI